MMLRRIIALVLLLAALAQPANAQITVPNVFTTTVPVSQLNTNFSTIADGALKRNGGTVTGNITVNAGVTIDGVDIGDVLGGSGTPTFETVTIDGAGVALTVDNSVAINGTSSTALDVAGGITAGTGNVNIISTDGRIADLDTSHVSATVQNVTYSAGNFTTAGALTWTVDSGDQQSYQYFQIGDLMYISFVIVNTSTGGVAANELRIDIPGSAVVAGSGVAVATAALYADDAGGTIEVGRIVAIAGNAYIQLFRAATANWSATAVNNTTLRGQIWIKVA